MKENWKGTLAERVLHLWREQSRLRIPVYAASAGYFIVLSLFPMLVLLLGLLRYTGLSVDTLTGFLAGFVPQALMMAAKRLIRSTYQNTSGMVISLSVLVALWSASRGMYGLMQGLNTVYRREEKRSWLHVRWLSMVYTGLFLVVVLATLIVSVFGMTLVQRLPVSPFSLVLERIIGMRFIVLLFLQTALFTGMFMVLPSKGNSFFGSVPGALLASLGWLIFSDLYSWYMVRFTGYANIFGSVYALALSMLWLYICLCILFFGGAWNYHRSQTRK